MRLLHVNQDPGVSPKRRKGAAVHLRTMRAAFADEGHEVLALDLPKEEALGRALEEARSTGPVDLVYERYSLGGYCTSRWAERHGIPHVLEVNAPLDLEAQRYRGSQLGLDPESECQLFRRADLLVAVSQGVVDFCLARGAEADRILLAPNAVDPDRFQPRTEQTPPLSGVPLRRTVIGFHGRLRPWHGFERLARAVCHLLERGHDVHLVTLGEGDFDELSSPLVPADRRLHLPWVDHDLVAPVLARFDLLPLAYAEDPGFYFSPLKLLEAMACGVVPVVPDVGDLAAMVGHGKAGLVYPSGVDSALALALENLVMNPDQRRRYAKAARELATQSTWRGVARKVLESLGSHAR